VALERLAEDSARERRRHVRFEVAAVIKVSPNGHANDTTLFDISESGARFGVPEDFEHGDGALVRLHFTKAQRPSVLFAEIKRVTGDHIGVQFADNQDELVLQLIEELSGG